MQILELIWIQNWFVYYEHMVQKWRFWCMRLQHLKITMRSSGFHHLCVKMRLRRANYGIDMDPKLIGLLWTYDAKKWPFQCLRLQNLDCYISLPRFLPSLPPLLTGGCLITIPRPPPIVIDVPNWNNKMLPYTCVCIHIYIYIYLLDQDGAVRVDLRLDEGQRPAHAARVPHIYIYIYI